MTTVSAIPRKRMPRAERSVQLLEVAEAVFAERGIAAASMEEIAERAGVTKPVLYDHFGSKDGLLAAVIDRAGAELRSAVADAVMWAEAADDALARGLRAYFTFIAKHRAAWLALLSETTTSGAAAETLERIRQELSTFMATLIAAEVPDGDLGRATTYAQAVIGASERLATAPREDEDLSPETLTSHLMDVLWLGFAAVRNGQRWS